MSSAPVYRIAFLMLTLFTCRPLYTQQLRQLQVIDRHSEKPVPYAAIGIRHSTRGYLANDEGRFSAIIAADDTLVINMVGYKKRLVAANEISATIAIEPSPETIKEVAVHPDDEYLYDAVTRCRHKLLQEPAKRSKAYFLVQSESQGAPTELIECYYNSTHSCRSIDELTFKNGRAMLATADSTYFMCVDISHAFVYNDLAIPYDRLPVSPLQTGRKKMRRHFELKLQGYDGENGDLIHISFVPRKKQNQTHYSGDFWINTTDHSLAKVILESVQTKRHPFSSLHRNVAEIENVNLRFEKHFVSQQGSVFPRNAVTSYTFDYVPLKKSRKRTRIASSALLYFYDYGDLFIPPYFEYKGSPTDYRKIQALSYNEDFWNTNNSVMYSESMKEKVRYFKTHGMLFNHRNQVVTGRQFNKEESFFEHPFLQWSKQTRLLIRKGGILQDTSVTTGKLLSLEKLFQLRGQIYLDVNIANGVPQWHSAAIFDTYNSYFSDHPTPEVHCFINIYFDLFEIERRSMHKALLEKSYTVSQIDSVYRSHKLNVEEDTEQFQVETLRGTDKKALARWNDYVKSELGVDNFGIFGVAVKP